MAARVGSTFKITNLFYNTPARLKHLSSSYAELANVIEYVDKIALSYPFIRFKLINDDKVIRETSGTGNLLKVINSIYNLDITKKMIKVEGSNSDYSITGYISLPEVTRSSRNHMTTIVNGRVVKNTTLYRSINEAYSNYKEDTRYPICALIIECDPSLLDVNIHPSKLDIKFSNFDELNKLIKELIDTALKNKLLIPTINLVKESPSKTYENLTLNIEREESNQVSESSAYQEKLTNLVNFNNQDEIPAELLEELSEVKTVTEKDKLPELYPVGLLLGTYIVCENEQGIYLIDQHAAKERVNYEKVSHELSHPTGNTVSPLVPIVIELPKNEYLKIK